MKKFLNNAKNFVAKHGGVIACCAFAFVTIAANSPCALPFYEPEEPQGLNAYKNKHSHHIPKTYSDSGGGLIPQPPEAAGCYILWQHRGVRQGKPFLIFFHFIFIPYFL